jgi:hypothetical protein
MKTILLFTGLLLTIVSVNSQILNPHSEPSFWGPVINPSCKVFPGQVPATWDTVPTIARAYEIRSEEFTVPVLCLEADTMCLNKVSGRNRSSIVRHPSLPAGRVWLFMYPDGMYMKVRDIRTLIRFGEVPFPQGGPNQSLPVKGKGRKR